MNKRVITTVLLLLALSAIACTCSLPGLSNLLGDSNTDAGKPPAANALFFDDFSNPDSGWDHRNDASGTTDYYNGQYRILVLESNIDLWANPNTSFPADVIIEVQAYKNDGPDDNDFGVMCRYQGVDNYVFFVISSDGYAAIGKMEDGSQNLLNPEGQMVPVDALPTGEGITYQIRAECVGPNLALFVNGKKIMEAQDPAPAAGDVGLMAGTFDTPGTDILFDNFTVLAP
ncbi:MAG: hypothetical protein GXO56_02755 [Chloroflexi bacterium]|nr:hypothetical protein [Chloroflexota bacterium]